MASTAEDFYTNIVDAILFDYCRFYISGEFKSTSDDEAGHKCAAAAEVLAKEWFCFDFDDTTKLKEFEKLIGSLDYNITNDIVKKELEWIYNYVKTENPSHPKDILYCKRVAKAVKKLLKLDYHMSKEEIKALKNKENKDD